MQTPPPNRTTVPDWLSHWKREGLSREDAIDRFLNLPPMEIDDMIGQWKRSELATSHHFDIPLSSFGLYGKNFVSADECYPLVMTTGAGGQYFLNPRFVPLHLLYAHPSLFNNAAVPMLARCFGRLFATKKPKALLRPVALGGTISAAMIYDDKPIIDHFRRIDDQTCVGLMEYRHFDRPIFFLMTRY